MSEKKTVRVAIALVWRDGTLLVSQRRQSQHQGGLWEFPGGKIEGTESVLSCAEREVLEEVGIVVRAERERATITYEYDDRIVELHPVDCRYDSGQPRPRQVTEVRWVAPAELAELAFPAANAGLLLELVTS